MKKTVITMPESMLDAMRQRVEERFYGSISEYLRHLVRTDLSDVPSNPAGHKPRLDIDAIEDRPDRIDLSDVYEVWEHSGGRDDDDEDDDQDEDEEYDR